MAHRDAGGAGAIHIIRFGLSLGEFGLSLGEVAAASIVPFRRFNLRLGDCLDTGSGGAERMPST
ncbi:hypothetical protein A6024_08125 [Rhodovulum sulfidophilum]|nr:hypothetical protein A6W98_08270 [Rhodovulum sulfidophilum DSM 1374]ANB37885.1 hypothetical protein A6024_08125 [Rhodovulum sulfidophilum]